MPPSKPQASVKAPQIPQVAILLHTMQSWSRLILKGILSYAHEVGPWHVWINSPVVKSLNELPKGWRGDGVIARVDTPELAEELNDLGLPVIDVSDNPMDGFSAPRVRTDDETGTRMAAQHFIDRGLRNLAFFGPNHLPNPIWYADAFEAAVDSHGLSCHRLQVGSNEPDMQEKLAEWLTALPKPIGILVWGHGYAREVVDCCMEVGIVVPHDVAVLGGSYDELFSHACFPSLSGVLAPTEQIGYRAAGLLDQLMKGEEVEHETTYLPPRGIMERLSTDTLAVKDPQLIQVIEFMRKSAFEPITVDDILKTVPMARRSLERRFQQAFGRSPTEEIRRIRIDKARKLLAETDLQMQEIAEACGYATYNYLTHVFKQTTGLTPRDYRKQFRS